MNSTIKSADELNVYIHIGMPKAGSSALQYWLNENSDFLAEHGYYYPKHELDVNMVSMGNMLSIITNCSNQVKFDVDKALSLKKRCVEQQYHTILLSSEGFFNIFAFDVQNEVKDHIIKMFPKVRFVLYVRNLSEFVQSSYVQCVKREYQICRRFDLSLGQNELKQTIKRIKAIIDYTECERLIVRTLSKESLYKRSLINDFLFVAGDVVENLPAIMNAVVNESYCYESLEFKRHLNLLDILHFEQFVDVWLQKYPGGMKKYNLLQTNEWQVLQNDTRQSINALISEYDCEELKGLCVLTNEKMDERPYVNNELTVEQYCAIFTYLSENDYDGTQQLCEYVLAKAKEYNDCPTLLALFYGASQTISALNDTDYMYYRQLTINDIDEIQCGYRDQLRMLEEYVQGQCARLITPQQVLSQEMINQIHLDCIERTLSLKHEKLLIMENGYFNPRFYYGQWSVGDDNASLLDDYCEIGWKAGRNPNINFSVEGYLKAYPHVKQLGINPLIHYIVLGCKLGYHLVSTCTTLPSDDILLAFDGERYLAIHHDVKSAKIDPRWHFVVAGYNEGRVLAYE